MYNEILFKKLIKKKNPLISIIIPTRNRWGILKNRALPSVMNQTYKNFELIIVDDDSDRPIFDITIFAPYARIEEPPLGIDKRIKLVRLSPKVYHYPKDDKKAEWLVGPVCALNKGLQVAKGDFIARLDDDDEWYPWFLSASLNCCKAWQTEFFSATYYKNGRLVDPYVIDGHVLGAVQTWLYAGYLKNFRYDPDSWKKKWNRNNDIDLPERMFKAGVKSSYIRIPFVNIEPRPGLDCTGSVAYLREHEND